MKTLLAIFVFALSGVVSASELEEYKIKFDNYFFLGKNSFESTKQIEKMTIFSASGSYWIDFNGNSIPLEVVDIDLNVIVLKQQVFFSGTRTITLFKNTKNVIFSEIAVPKRIEYVKEKYKVQETVIIKRGKYKVK